LEKRAENCMHSGTVHILISRRELRKRQRKGGENSRKFMSVRQASCASCRASTLAQGGRKESRGRSPCARKGGGNGGVTFTLSRRFFSEIGRKGGRNALRTRRKAAARKAALARWHGQANGAG